jgi:hypothetical protein
MVLQHVSGLNEFLNLRIGMTYVSPDTPYMKLLAPLLEKKKKLAVDAWGADTSLPEIRAAYEPLESFIERNIEEKYRKLYPPIWNHEARAGRYVPVYALQRALQGQLKRCSDSPDVSWSRNISYPSGPITFPGSRRRISTH